MINVADRIELHSFQNDLLNDPFTKLYKGNNLKKYLKDRISKRYGKEFAEGLESLAS